MLLTDPFRYILAKGRDTLPGLVICTMFLASGKWLVGSQELTLQLHNAGKVVYFLV